MRQPTSVRNPSAQRTILFLQGVASPFFAELGRNLKARGHRVRRINFSLGDELFWPLPATGYRGSLSNWRKFLAAYLARQGITDIVLFGDCRPYHRIAIGLAAHHRVQVHVLEEGYLRPYWITVEQGGVNGHSSLPADPDEIRRLAAELEPPLQAEFAGSFVRRAVWDVTYSFANMLGRPMYPGYRRHRPNHVLVEYSGWLRRLARGRKVERHAEAAVKRAVSLRHGFFLVPLQLDSDYQIRIHSRFADLREFLEEALASFARHAPPDVELLIKVHPLDPGLVDRPAQIAALAARHGVIRRVTTIEGGHLPTLLAAARGVVVVNSTVGSSALEARRPTIALGTAIYNIPGLTFQDGLDRFWTEAAPPDFDLFTAFRTLIVHRTLVNGGFFCRQGIAMAVGVAADRVLAAEQIHYGYWAGGRLESVPAPLYPTPYPAE